MTEPARAAEGGDVILRIRAGDRAAFNSFVRSHYPGLCSYVFRLTESRTVAEDLVQDVLLAVWESRERLDPDRNLKSYLYTAARNRTRNYLKRRKLHDHWRERVSTVPQRGRRYTDEDVEYAELLEAVQKAVVELPQRRREVFILSRQHGLSYAEIGDILGISGKAVEAHIARSLAFLRKKLSAFIAEP